MSAGRKYAYVGAWLGELGAADMSRIEGRNFFILDERDGKKFLREKSRDAARNPSITARRLQEKTFTNSTFRPSRARENIIST